MRNVLFVILLERIKPVKNKFPTLTYKYIEWAKYACRGGHGQVMDIAVIHEIQDDEEEENDNQ